MQAHHDLTSQPSDARKKAQGKSKENNKMKAAGCLFAKTRSVQGNVKFSPGFPKKIIPFPPFLCPMLRCQIATGHSDLGGGAKRFFMGPFSHLGTRSTGGGGSGGWAADRRGVIERGMPPKDGMGNTNGDMAKGGEVEPHCARTTIDACVCVWPWPFPASSSLLVCLSPPPRLLPSCCPVLLSLCFAGSFS